MRYRMTLAAALVKWAEFDENDDADAQIAGLVEQAEGDLSALNDDKLAALRSALADVYAAARPNASTNEAVEQLTRLAAAINAIDSDVDRRTAEAAAREEALAALDAQVAPEGDETEPSGDEGEPEGDLSAQVEDSEPVETPEERTVASVNPVSLTGLGAFRNAPGANPENVPAAGGLSRLTAGAALLNVDPNAAGGYSSIERLGEGIHRLADSLRVSAPTQRKHYIGTIATRTGPGERIVDMRDYGGSHAESSQAALDEATSRALASRNDLARARQEGDARLTASGGMCAVAQPDYAVTLIGEEGTQFVQTLPTVTGSRAIEYYPWLEVDLHNATRREAPFANDTDPFDATGRVTEAQDAAGYVSQGGPTPDKDCLHIDCISPKTCTLEATFRCVTIGNFMANAFPELVEAFDRYTRIGFDQARDARAQAKILGDANAKIVEGDSVFGAAVDVLGRIRYLARTIRSTRGNSTLPIDVYLPDFAGDLLAQDIATSMFNTSGLSVTAVQALGILGAVENIHVMIYRTTWGTTSDGSPTVLPKQLAGPIGDWPTQIRIAMWPTGTVFHQQGWELSFGLRETLRGTNDFGTFYELAEATCTRGSDIYFLDQGICVNGARGAAAATGCGAQAIVDDGDGGGGGGNP